MFLFQRTEKGKEYDLFVLKIQKLEKLCRVLQEERVVLYDKIKDVRKASSGAQAKLLSGSQPDPSVLLTPTEIQEIQEEDPVLTEDMSRLREEQNKLQEFAASLFATPTKKEEPEQEPKLDVEEDEVSSAFMQFKTKTQPRTDSVPEKLENPPEEQKGHDEAAKQQPPADPEPTPGPSADLKPQAEPEVSIQNTDPVQVQDEAEQRQEEKVAPPTDTSPTLSSDSSKKQMSKKKKKRGTKNVS